MSTPVQQQALSALLPEDVEKVQTVLKPYKYGIDIEACLQPDSKFQAVFMRDYVSLKSYCVDGSQRGICADVAAQAAKELKQVLGDRYEIKGAVGGCFEFDTGQHCYLLVWQKDNDFLVSRTLKPGLDFAAGVSIVDPTFRTIYQDPSDSNYRLDRWFPDSDIKFEPDMHLTYKNELRTGMQPIGYLNEIDSQLARKFPDRTIIYIGFERNSQWEKPEIYLATTSGTGKVKALSSEQLDSIGGQSLLGKFLYKINTQLNEQAELVTPPRPESSSLK